MAKATKVAAIRVIPIRGKYYECHLDGYGKQCIWKMLPGNEGKDPTVWGTPVPAEVAYQLLMLRPDMVKLAPALPGEDYSSVFTEEQLADIKSKQLYGYPVSRAAQEDPDVKPAATDKTARAMQAKMDALEADNAQLKVQINKLTDTLNRFVQSKS